MNRFSASMRRQRGIGLIEIIAVVAIIALILAFALRNQNTAETGANRTGLISQVQTLHQGMRNCWQRNRYVAPVTSAALITCQTAPNEMINGTALQHDFSGPVTLAAGNCNGGTSNCGVSTWSAIPSANCMATVQALEQFAHRIRVDATEAKPAGGALDRSAATTACSAGNTVALEFTVI